MCNLGRQLSQRYLNDFDTRFKKLPKNKQNYNEFESYYKNWLDTEFKFDFSPEEEATGILFFVM